MIMRNQESEARWRFEPTPSRFSLFRDGLSREPSRARRVWWIRRLDMEDGKMAMQRQELDKRETAV
jgi:hypothetical protein